MAPMRGPIKGSPPLMPEITELAALGLTPYSYFPISRPLLSLFFPEKDEGEKSLE